MNTNEIKQGQVVARQVDDKRRLFAERNEARAVLELVAGNLAAWADKREEAPESAQEHMDEAMHALVRFRPDGGYSEAASKLRLEMWHGEIYAERDAERARADGLASDLAVCVRLRDKALAKLDELRTEWFGIAGGEQSFPSDRTGDAMAQHQVDAWLADGQKALADLAAAQAKLANLHGWCGQKRAEWTAEARGASSKSVSASCSMAASAFDEVAKKIAELGIAAAEQGCAAVGIDGQRDPDHPCDMFRNGKPSERNTCEGDGHYLCNECGHFRCDPPEQSGQPASGAVPAGGRR